MMDVILLLTFHFLCRWWQVRAENTQSPTGIDYGSRKGESLIGTYRGGKDPSKHFQVWHCRLAFKKGDKCVDGVCGQCYLKYNKMGHKCSKCRQKMEDYKGEDNEKWMPRKRARWEGPGPERCAICDIVLCIWNKMIINLSILFAYTQKQNILPYCCHAKTSKSVVVWVVVCHVSRDFCGKIWWPYCWLNFCFFCHAFRHIKEEIK